MGGGQARRDLICSAFGGSIIADPNQAIVVRAGERYWRRYPAKWNIDKALNKPPSGRKRFGRAKLNQAVIRAFFGNADIAVVMDGPGSFTVKGVRLDADKAIRASFDVLQQGIKYMAFASGVPVTLPATATGGEPSIQTIPELADQDSAKADLEDAAALSDLHMSAVLNVLFSTATAKDIKDKAKRKSAIMAIKKAFEVMEQSRTNTSTNAND